MNIKPLLLNLARKALRRSSWSRCYLLSRCPPVIVSFWRNFYDNADDIFPTVAGAPEPHILSSLFWHHETVERADSLALEARDLQTRFSNINLLFLCNSNRESNLLSERGLQAIFCHQNAFLDERIYPINPAIPKKFDAIYVARIDRIKRHYLAQKIESLQLIGDTAPEEEDYYKETMRQLAHASWERYVPAVFMYKELNAARVGLCLSAEEGAMYASAEYLLCGLPVVSTKSLGGRDEFFDPEYVVIVEDNPESVANGVRELISRNIDPMHIRERTLAKMQPHRDKLLEVLTRICDKSGQPAPRWSDFFTNKLGYGTRPGRKLFRERALQKNWKLEG